MKLKKQLSFLENGKKSKTEVYFYKRGSFVFVFGERVLGCHMRWGAVTVEKEKGT